MRAGYSKSYAGLLHGSVSAREMRRKDEELERAAIVVLTEGGGGALYQVCGMLKKRGIEEKIAAVFRQTYRMKCNTKTAVLGHWQRWSKMKPRSNALHGLFAMPTPEHAQQQFGFPLNEAEMKALNERARQCDASVFFNRFLGLDLPLPYRRC